MTDALLAEKMPPDVLFACSVFTGDVETDPERVGLWRVEVTTGGLLLESACGPPDCYREERRGCWADLYDILVRRDAMQEDIAWLDREIAEREERLVSLRVEARQLKALIMRRRALVGVADPESDQP